MGDALIVPMKKPVWTLNWIVESTIVWTIIVGMLFAGLFYLWPLFPLAIIAGLLRVHSDRFIQ
jgi:hypothetical protein